MDEAGVSHGVKQREAAPQSVEDSNVDSNVLCSSVEASRLLTDYRVSSVLSHLRSFNSNSSVKQVALIGVRYE